MGGQPNEYGLCKRLVNPVIAVAFAFMLAFGDWTQWMTQASGQLLAWIAKLFHLNVVFIDGQLTWQNVSVCWTDQCSGVSALFVLAGVTIWVSLAESTPRLLLRLASCFPLAIGANTLRVIMICVFREAFYPRWEGITLHYVFGLVSILPLLIFVGRGKLAKADVSFSSIVYLASILAVCSARLEDPEGVFVLAATVAYLLPLLPSDQIVSVCSWRAALIWIVSGCMIAGIGAESLWLPWLLASPCLFDASTRRHWWSQLLLVGTVPLFAAYWVVQAGVLILLMLQVTVLFTVFRRGQDTDQNARDPSWKTPLAGVTALVSFAAFLLPSASGVFPAYGAQGISPPASVMRQSAGDGVYRVRMIGQSHGIAAFWCGAADQGRHHSIRTCLAFRGIEAVDASNDGTMETDVMWVREFFLLEENLLSSYSGYVTRCFPPLTSHGVHIVFQASKNSVDQEHFIQETQRIASQLKHAHAK